MLFLSLFVLSVAGLFLIRDILPERETVLITVEGKPVAVFPLGEDRTISVDGFAGKTLVEISGNRVRISASPCPNKLCVSRGWIRTGSVICLPNRVTATISGRFDKNAKSDAVTR